MENKLKGINYEEKKVKSISCFLGLLLIFILLIGGVLLLIYGESLENEFLIFLGVICEIIGFNSFRGLKKLDPNQGYVFTLFGKYYGTLKSEGFYFVNPFVTAINPISDLGNLTRISTSSSSEKAGDSSADRTGERLYLSKKISLKTMTLNNTKQKVNDALGNPINIGIVVIWKIINPTKAVFNVDNYMEFLSIQTDSSLRNIVRLYPYDADDSTAEKSLRGSSEEVAEVIRKEIQSKVEVAGIEVLEARITNLAYAPEIAASMLQRQQAQAVIDARQKIVEGAVSMVGMALEQLDKDKIVNLDEERKAQMVSNLLVILCANKDAQPIVNSGSIY